MVKVCNLVDNKNAVCKCNNIYKKYIPKVYKRVGKNDCLVVNYNIRCSKCGKVQEFDIYNY